MDAIRADHLDAGLWRLTGASLADVERAAALRTRVDRKYILTTGEATALVDDLSGSLGVLEIGTRRSFRYESVYFDTADRRSYLMAARRRPTQFKVRVRSYEGTDASMLEVKTKSRRGETMKFRVPYGSDPRDPLTADGCRFVDDVLDLPGIGAELVPAVTTSYLRSTVVDTEVGWRVTIDRSIRMEEGHGPVVGLGERVVVETKSMKATTPVDRWLWARHRRPRALSKFAVGTAALHHELPRHKWHRVMGLHVVGAESAASRTLPPDEAGPHDG